MLVLRDSSKDLRAFILEIAFIASSLRVIGSSDLHHIDIEILHSEIVNFDDAERYLCLLNACRCCDRHQDRKPSKIIGRDEYPISDLFNNSCDCNCRHLSRHICRATHYIQYF